MSTEHIHLIGIGGTGMTALAGLLHESGCRVTGSDGALYPPTSTILADLGVAVYEGFDAAHLDPAPDLVVVGNAISRGNAEVEAVLDGRLRYTSMPRLIHDRFLIGRHSIVIAGTHGKTTTASMLAAVLTRAGREPGYLIGGLPHDLERPFAIGKGPAFVIEGDEYDTAFFDKRAKFVHYRPQTLVLGNLEFDHADIYKDLDAILWQFHQLLRTIPKSGRIISNSSDDNLKTLLELGCWSSTESFGIGDGDEDWTAQFLDAGGRRIAASERGGASAEGSWQLSGSHNLENALAAIAAAKSAGVSLQQAIEAVSRFKGVKRRLERTATVSDVAIYDDFAHHPTAIRRTIAGLKKRFPGQRIVIALEPRSNTMKLGVHNDTLAASLKDANLICMYRPSDLAKNFDDCLAPLGDRLHLHSDYDELVADLAAEVQPGDQVVFMSNGEFGSARQNLTDALQNRK